MDFAEVGIQDMGFPDFFWFKMEHSGKEPSPGGFVRHDFFEGKINFRLHQKIIHSFGSSFLVGFGIFFV